MIPLCPKCAHPLMAIGAEPYQCTNPHEVHHVVSSAFGLIPCDPPAVAPTEPAPEVPVAPTEEPEKDALAHPPEPDQAGPAPTKPAKHK